MRQNGSVVMIPCKKGAENEAFRTSVGVENEAKGGAKGTFVDENVKMCFWINMVIMRVGDDSVQKEKSGIMRL